MEEETGEVIEFITIKMAKDLAETKLGKTKLLTLLKQMGAEVVGSETSLNGEVHAAADVQAVFDYHQSVLAEHFPRGLKLKDWRQQIIRSRLRSFSVEQLKLVIDQVSRSPFHLCLPGSGNDSGKKYLDFDHIMGNDKKVERKLEGVDKMTQHANEIDDLRLTLRRLGASMRTGGAGLAETERFQASVGRLKELTGEIYLWKDDVFERQ